MKIQYYTVTDVLDAIYSKGQTLPCFLFNPQSSLEEVGLEKTQFMIPTYRVKVADVEAWLGKMASAPPNPIMKFEGILVQFNDLDGAEPRFGAAIRAIDPIAL